MSTNTNQQIIVVYPENIQYYIQNEDENNIYNLNNNETEIIDAEIVDVYKDNNSIISPTLFLVVTFSVIIIFILYFQKN